MLTCVVSSNFSFLGVRCEKIVLAEKVCLLMTIWSTHASKSYLLSQRFRFFNKNAVASALAQYANQPMLEIEFLFFHNRFFFSVSLYTCVCIIHRPKINSGKEWTNEKKLIDRVLLSKRISMSQSVLNTFFFWMIDVSSHSEFLYLVCLSSRLYAASES